MKNKDIISSLVWIFFGGLFVAGSLDQGLMRMGIPGPGFLPFFSGLALICLSIFILIPALVHRKNQVAKEDFFPESDSFKKILSAIVALFAFGALLKHVGYVLTTFFFMFFAGLIMESKRWRSIIVLSFLTALMTYLLFDIFLELQLPKGFLEF